jgi:hypothetical protein
MSDVQKSAAGTYQKYLPIACLEKLRLRDRDDAARPNEDVRCGMGQDEGCREDWRSDLPAVLGDLLEKLVSDQRRVESRATSPTLR